MKLSAWLQKRLLTFEPITLYRAETVWKAEPFARFPPARGNEEQLESNIHLLGRS
jgi:hypothetical protein